MQILFATVDIDKTIALGVALMRADQIDSSPRAVTQQIDTIVNRQLHLFDMRTHKIDAVIIIDDISRQ
ncbi:hypothetical protein D3C76_1795380 [compost metagenome]